ncbi:MAG: MFS transporter [Candidatus Heimdallarchaeota archaeon]|nr:MFS transporter [Candidatus Heimdallarchaeota archaeon]
MPSKENESQNLTDKPSITGVLKNRAFMTLFSAQFIENVGRAISGLALEFFIYELTGSPLMMGILAFIWLAPFVFVAPFAGVYTDRLDQRKIMLASNITGCFASLGFVIIYLLYSMGYLLTYTYVDGFYDSGLPITIVVVSVKHVIWPLMVLLFINSTAAAFFFPARSAYTRLIVEKKNLLVANSIGSTVFQIATIVGYVLAGILAAKSYLGSFIFDASTFFVSALFVGLLFKVGKKPPKVERERSESLRAEMKSFVKDMKIGYRTIRDYPKISYMLIIFSALTFAFGAINVLFIVILQGEMHLGQVSYGLLQALMGGTGIVTALILMSIGKLNRKIMIINFTFLVVAGAMYIFAISRNVFVIATVLGIYGVLSVLINVPSSTIIQETVPYDKQGRVFGTQQLAQGISQLLGMAIVSSIAEFVLPMYVLLGSSVILTFITIFGFSFSIKKGLMRSDYPLVDVSQATKEEPPFDDALENDKKMTPISTAATTTVTLND